MANTPAMALFEVLVRHGVPFVVIGGHAVNFHGYIRATEDHDIIFQRSPDSEAALLLALQELNAAWISDEIDPTTGLERLVPVTPSYVRHQHLMMLHTDAGYLDVFDHIPGFPHEPVARLFDSAEQLHGIHYVSLQWLRRMKAASGRPRDLDDLENLPGIEQEGR